MARGTSGQEGMPPIVVDAGALDLLPCHVVPQVVITPLPANWPHC